MFQICGPAYILSFVIVLLIIVRKKILTKIIKKHFGFQKKESLKTINNMYISGPKHSFFAVYNIWHHQIPCPLILLNVHTHYLKSLTAYLERK